MGALLLSLAAVLTTSAGGFLAFRLRDHLKLVLVFASSTVLAVVCLDLLPEIFEIENRIGGDGWHAIAMLTGGFLAVHAFDRFTMHDRAQHCAGAPRHQAGIGLMSASAMVGHSFLDGVGIGVAFQVAPEVGLAFATGVVAHDFCDGLNTVGFVLAHGNSQKNAQRMLLLNAMAPVLGALSTLAFRLPPEALSACLGLFAGMLLRVGMAGVLPSLRRTGHSGPTQRFALLALGATAVCAAILAGALA